MSFRTRATSETFTSKETIQMTSRPTRRLMALLSSLLVALAAVVALWPAGAHAAPDLEVALKGSRSEAQMVTVRGASSGQFRLRYGAGGLGVAVTPDLAVNASGAEVQGALNGLTNINAGGGSVTVIGRPAGGSELMESLYRVIFDGGPLEGADVPELVAVEGATPIASNFPDRLGVETIEEAGIRSNDRRIDYHATVSNSASIDPGDVLTCDPRSASWGGSPTFGYQWVRDGVSLGAANGAQTAEYTVQPADAGRVLQCTVLGSNAAGSSLSFSDSIAVAPLQVPRAPSWPPGHAASRPTVTGGLAAQRTCAAQAVWSVDHDGDPATPGVAYNGPWQYQWLRNGQPIPGATSSTYTPQAGPGEPDELKNLQCQITGSNASGAAVAVSNNSPTATSEAFTTAFGSQPPQNFVGANLRPFVASGDSTSGPVTLEIELPPGLDTRALAIYNRYSGSPIPIPGNLLSGPVVDGWSCVAHEASVSISARVVCTRSDSLGPHQSYPPIGIGVRLGADTPDLATVTATVTGGGDPTPGVTSDQFDRSAEALPFGIAANGMATELIDRFWNDHTQAGGHPWAGYAKVRFNGHRRAKVGHMYESEGPNGNVKVLRTDIPAGLVGNPLAPTELCDDPAKIIVGGLAGCPAGSVVGSAGWRSYGTGDGQAGTSWAVKPLAAVEPERGVAAQFAFGDDTTKGVYVVDARLDPANNYSVVLETAPIAHGILEFQALGATICSYGADLTVSGISTTGCRKSGDPGAFAKPLLTAPTACEDNQQTKMTANSWERPDVFSSLSVAEPAMSGCDQVPFTPAVAMSPTSSVAGGPSGLDASISVPSDGLEDPDGIAQAHLKKTVVELPAGVSVNPSAATGLQGCTDAQLGLKTDSEPGCPDGSKIAEVTATTPVLEETLTGVMVLRTPESTDPMSGGMFRMALIVRNDERGILVKLPGSATADPQTGRLTATFDDNPQLPIGDIDVEVKGGSRGVLAMPQDCGEVSTKASLTPWSGGADAVSSTPSSVDEGCGGGFAPKLAAGNSDNRARGQGGTYSFKFTRDEGEQWLRGLTAKLPQGLLASVRDVPLCSNGAADAGNCPAASKIGVVDAKAGAGDPFVLEEKGEVFLTEGHKGGEYGLAVKVRPVAGPFRGSMELSPIVVRQAIHVDRTTAQVTAISDPFPLIHHGVPLRVREVNVLVNRGGFMLNPSDCAAKQTRASLLSNEGATANLSDAFQVSDCGDLAFKPKLTLGLSGKRQVTTGKHPGINAKVTQQGTSEAGIEKAVVRLPKSLALDVNNAQALCEFEDGTKPDLENHCPKGSIVGRARAVTPLLNRPLSGNVYFVKNIRRDPKTGNVIRTLPMIIAALRGEIAINLVGTSEVKGGKLVSIFEGVPDAPVSRFNLNIRGGGNGIIAVTRTRRSLINLCAKPRGHVAESDMDAHNGRRHDTDITMKTPCSKRQVSKAKRAARKAARKAR